MPQGEDYGKAVKAIQDAAELHAKEETWIANNDKDPQTPLPGTQSDQSGQSAFGSVRGDRAAYAPPQIARTTDLSTETGGIGAAYTMRRPTKKWDR